MKKCLLAVMLLTACRTPAPRALTPEDNKQLKECLAQCVDKYTPAPEPQSDALPPQPDASQAGGAQISTIVDLDWSAFPVDKGPNYTTGGKAIEVSPPATIAAAIEKASPGDIILVHAGTYREHLTVDKANLVITAAPGETVWLESTSGGRGVDIRGDGVVFNGINLRGFNPAIHVGLETRTQRNVVISNLTAEAPSGADFYDGIADYETTKAPSMEGLLIKNVVLKRFSLSVTCGNGFCKSWKLENVRVTGLGTSDSWGADGVAFENADNILLTGVEVSNVSSDGIDTKATRVVVHNCYVHNVGNNGIKMWKGGDIINTRVNSSGEAPIVFAEGPKARVINSLVAGQPVGGGWSVVFAYGNKQPVDIEFANNILANTKGGIYANAAAALNVHHNIFWATQSGRIIDAKGIQITLAQGNAAIKAAGWGDGNQVIDPKLDASNQPTAETPTSAGPTRSAKKVARR